MEYSIAELLTIPGATLAAVALTKAATSLGLPTRWARRFAVAAGMVLLVGATAITAGLSVGALFAAIPTGCAAGLAAVAAYDAGRSGFDYAVIPSADYLRPGPR